MRSLLTDYEIRAPATLDEALRLMADEPGRWRPLAGSTDVMVLLEAGKLTHTRFLSVWHLDDLRGIDITPTTVILRALTTYTEVLRSDILRAQFPLMGAAAAETGSIATQNRGTIGGNVANASPAADTPPALLVYDAELEIVSARGTRRVPYAQFHRGYKLMDLAPDELIAAVHLPRGASRSHETYRKVGTRRAQAISKVCFAATADIAGASVRDVRIALGSVAPVCVRALHAEDALRGHRLDDAVIASARAALALDIAPIDDMRSTMRYRARVAGNLLDAFLTQAAAG